VDPVELVERYFSAVDNKHMDAVLSCIAPDAEFRVATFDTVFVGRDTSIRRMFQRLFDRYERIWHGDFRHIVGMDGCVASQFTVINETSDGEKLEKFNANFFSIENGLFTRITVYMSGDNSLE